MSKKTILIGADIVPTANNVHLFESGDVSALLGEELKGVFDGSDYKIFNLEVPISDIREPILKTGPNLFASEACVKGYSEMGIDLLALANNHVLDQGKRAFADTLRVLDENGIAHVGGGLSEKEVKQPHTFELGGVKFGVINFCEHEFSWFADYGIGSNGFDPLYSLDEVAELKSRCDYVIAIYHGGRENYRYPSPELRRICRRITEKGADLVLCQHTHCIGSGETHAGGEIIYGQGNALFSKIGLSTDCWNTGMLVRLTVEDGRVERDLIPLEITRLGVKLSHDPTILEGFNKRSAEIKEEGFVERKYLELVREQEKTVLEHFGFFAEAHIPYTKKGAGARNVINCAPHRELIVTYLTELHGLK